jgi:hypothetical protein
MAFLPSPQINVQTSVPSSSATPIAMGVEVGCYVAVPAAGLANLAFSLPAAPPDGTQFRGVSTQTITTFALSSQGADSLVGAPTALTANVGFTMIYVKANTTWYRIG